MTDLIQNARWRPGDYVHFSAIRTVTNLQASILDCDWHLNVNDQM
jgi:hypothetical protein